MKKTSKIISVFLIVTMIFMTFSVGAFAGSYEDDYIKVDYPENYDVTEYSQSGEEMIGFYVDLYFSEWENIEGKEYYTGNTVNLIIEYYDIDSPDEVYDAAYLETLDYIVDSVSNIQSKETYHETIDGYDVLFYDVYYTERFEGENGERIAEDRLYSEAYVVHNKCLVQMQMYVADADDFKQYRNETVSKFLACITYDVEEIEEYGDEELGLVLFFLAIIFGGPLIIVIIAVIVLIVLHNKKKQQQQPMMSVAYYCPPQPIMPINQPVVTPPQPVVPDSQEMDKTTDIKEENNNEIR